jgi:hypothetical protein
MLISPIGVCGTLSLVTAMDMTTKGLGAPEALKKNLDWYIANQKELAAKYNGKVLLIVDQKLVKAFDSIAEAYAVASSSYVEGTFTLQPCSPDPESYTLMLADPVYAVLV